MLLQQSI